MTKISSTAASDTSDEIVGDASSISIGVPIGLTRPMALAIAIDIVSSARKKKRPSRPISTPFRLSDSIRPSSVTGCAFSHHRLDFGLQHRGQSQRYGDGHEQPGAHQHARRREAWDHQEAAADAAEYDEGGEDDGGG